MSNKQRLSASVDSDLIEAVENAVKRGRSDTVSAWVNDALRLKLEHDRRLEALAVFVKDYENKSGEITPEEMRQAARRVQSRSITLGGLANRKASSRSPKAAR